MLSSESSPQADANIVFRKELKHLVRGTPIGELVIRRTTSYDFVDADGRRFANPKQVEVLVITIDNPAGERVVWMQVPMTAILDTQG